MSDQDRIRRYHLLGWAAAGVSFVSAGLGYISETARLVSLAVAALLFITAVIVRGGPA